MIRFFYALLGGFLLGVGFVILPFWPLALIGIVPILHALGGAKSNKDAFLLGWISGFSLYGCAVFAIFWHTLPLDWLPVFPFWFQVLLVAISWALTAAGLALSIGVFGLAAHKLASNSWLDIFIISAAWVLSEWIAMWEFSLQNAGPGSVLGAHFGLGLVGNLLSRDASLLQVAWLGGVYLLSFLAIACGVLVYRIIYAGQKERQILVGILLVATVSWGVGHAFLLRTPAPSGAGVRIAAISTQDPPVFYATAEDSQRTFDAISKVLPQTRGADVLILPESTGFLSTLQMNRRQFLMGIFATSSIPAIVDSETVRTNPTFLQSRLEYYDLRGHDTSIRFKYFLLPDGEYVPYFYTLLIRMLGQGKALDQVAEHRGFLAGAYPEPIQVRELSTAVLFCNEALSPSLYSSLARKGAQVFINVASHSWFHGSRLVAQQMRDVSKIRAVESRRWYVQATDVAQSFVLDPYGRVATSTVWGSVGAIRATIYPRNDGTPHVRFNTWVLWVCTLFLVSRVYTRVNVRKWAP